MPVDVSEDAGRGRAADVEAAAERILELLGWDECELSVVLTGDEAVRALNRQWRSKDAATDVLSFGQLEDAGETRVRSAIRKPKPGTHLGDVVISVDTALRQAAEGGWTPEEEINRLLVHGVLHLLGHEHEHGGAAERRKQAEEARISAALLRAGIPCAYEDAAR